MNAADDKVRAAMARLQQRVDELEAELAAKEQLNFELQAAAESSRNFRASVAAGYVDLDLDSLEA